MLTNKKFAVSKLNQAFDAMFKSALVYRILVLLIIVFGLWIRLIGLNKGMMGDEVVSINFASSDNFISNLRNGWHPPLYFFILRLWGKISGNVVFLRFLSVIFGMGVIAGVIKWISRYSRLAGILAGAYCAVLPLMILYSQMIRHYSFLLLETVFAFYFAFLISQNTKNISAYIGLMASLSFGVMTHLVGVMLIPSVLIYLFFITNGRSKLALKLIFVSFIFPITLFIGLLCYFLFNIFGRIEAENWPFMAMTVNNISSMLQITMGIDYIRADIWVTPHNMLFNGKLIKFVVFMFCMFLAVKIILLSDWKRSLPLFIAALVYWGEVILTSIFFIPIGISRTMLPGIIPFSGFMAVTVSSIKPRRLKVLAITFLCIICFIIPTKWLMSEAYKMHTGSWEQSARILDAMANSKDIALIYPSTSMNAINYFSDSLSKFRKVIPVKVGLAQVEDKLNEIISPIKKEGKYFRVVFVICAGDSGLKKRIETHARLEAYLKSNFGEPTYHKKFYEIELKLYEFKRK